MVINFNVYNIFDIKIFYYYYNYIKANKYYLLIFIFLRDFHINFPLLSFHNQIKLFYYCYNK